MEYRGGAFRVIDLAVRAVGRSEPGLVRSHNEDSMILNDALGFWGVFDGMGGHENGALASSTAARAFAALEVPLDFDAAVEVFAEEVHRTNAKLAQLAAENGGATMGTTAVGLLIRGRQFATGWVGDSRAYVYRRGGLFQLSVDHTHVQDLLDQGILTPEDAKDHPMSHVLTRALGVEAEVEVDFVQDEIEPGDRYLLCSDGLCGPVTDGQIRDLIRLPDPNEAVDALIKRAYDNGAPDNVTVVLVEIGGTPQ